MKRTITALLLVIATVTALAQGQIRGLILDKNTSEAMSFVSVALTPQGETAPTMGASSDAEGKFHFKNVKFGTYTLTLSFVGYKEVRKQVELNEKNHTISSAAPR